jgi:flavodoxin
MKTLVVYDSFFGNTERIAQAVGEALGSDVAVLRVTAVRPEHVTGLELLVVGSPTRAFSPTPEITRFLGSLPPHSLKGIKVAAFDTRIAPDDITSRVLLALVKLLGYAAKPIAEKLQKKGGKLLLPPEGFCVQGSEGPLKEGEAERAAEWAKQLLAAH